MSIALYDPNDIDSLPERLTIYGASDYATMEPRKGKKEPDFTEHGVFGLDSNHHLWAMDWWYGQYETDKSIQAFIKLLIAHRPSMWWNEGGVIDKAIGPAVRSAMIQSQTYFTLVESLPSIQDKGQKLQSFHAMAQSGAVHFPIRRKWADRVIEQLIKFPAGRWDDAADVCGLIARGLDKMQNPHVPRLDKPPELIPFTEKWLTWNDDHQKPKVRYF